jgi:hypothetical protein
MWLELWCWVAAFIVLRQCWLLPFILIDMQLGVRCFCLHVLLYHIAALVLYGFSLVFLYWYICFACWALANFTCISISLLSNILSILSCSEFHIGGMITRRVTALLTITTPVESTPTKMTGQCYYWDMLCGWM